jgi:predicted nucleotidyltransferase component of viral defense system
MTDKIVNISASVQAKLKNQSDESKHPYQELLQYYGMERFIYRLSKTKYANDFVLKGGLMFYSLGISMRRPTRDIDFLGNAAKVQKDMDRVIREVLSVQVPNDGITFDIDSLKILETQIDVDNHGIRVTVTGYLGKVRLPIQVDIGFFDEVATKILVDYPVLLSGMEKPRIKMYPLESVISEKLHAIVRFAELNSRWKDYYDIWLLSNTFQFDGRKLRDAIKATFKKRRTKLPTAIPYGLTEDFAAANQRNWKAFICKSKLQNKEFGDFKPIVADIWDFLKYPLQEKGSDQQSHHKTWKLGKGWV